MDVKETLKILRTELDMTQLELANALGVTHKTVSRWELGNAFPQSKIADAIIDFSKRKGASQRCIDNLQTALQDGRKKVLRVSKSKLYPVDRESICQLVDGSHNAIYVADIETNELLYANAKAEEYTGRNFVSGEKCYHFLLGQKEQCPECPKLQMMENESTTYHVVSPQSGKRLLVRGRKLKWNGRDAHEQYYFEEETDLEGQDGYQKLVDGLDVGIFTCWVHDDGGIEVNFVSDGYYGIVGSSRGKRFRYAGYAVMNAVCDEDKQRVQNTAYLAAKAQKPIRMKYKVWLDDGGKKELYMRAKFVKQESGKSLYYCTVMDVDGISD